MSIYDTLNEEQKKACFQTEGPVLILAGAGSGKTRVITHRIAYLMEECDVNPWNILAITFTNKAAGEMRSRVDSLIGFGAESVWISTFHSMCVRILRRFIDGIGYDTNFTIYDQDDARSVIRQILQDMRDTGDLKDRQVLSRISQAKNNMEDARYFEEHHQGTYQDEIIGKVYEEYEKRLKKNNALDFDDLLLKTVELFEARDDVLQNYQERFRYIMVDEYQDTNRVQFELVRQLSGKYRNLCVVGDDDQSIYKFRGADIRNILDFEKVFPDALVVKLEQNYRSTQNILSAANAVIANNTERKEKRLWSDRGPGDRVHVVRTSSGISEASFVAGDIKACMKRDSALTWSDFAVLYRTNAQSRLLEDALFKASIPYQIVGGHNFYDRAEVKDILSCLRTIDNGRDDVNSKRIINVPKRGIGATTVSRIDAFAAQFGISFFEACERVGEIEEISKAAKGKIEKFTELIHGLQDYAGVNSVDALVKQVVDVTDYNRYLRDFDPEGADDRIGNVDELISKATDFHKDYTEKLESGEIDDAGTELSAFLQDVSLIADIDQVDNDENGKVLLMTLHSAKGLEFPHVYITGMEENIFPSFMALGGPYGEEDSEAIEEERRLAYVGITRAKDDLTLVSAASRMVRGDVHYNPVSRFIGEIPKDLIEWRDDSYGLGGGFDEDDDDDLPFAPVRHVTSWQKPKPAAPAPKPVQKPAPSPVRKDTRPKAVLRKPDPAKKPFIARPAGLDSLSKGAPVIGKPGYDVGDRVQHVKYGEGTVLAIEKGPRDYKVTVKFDTEEKQRIMYAAFAKLVKIS